MAILKNYIEGNLTQLNKLKYGDTATIGNEPIVQKSIPTDIRKEGPSSNGISRRVDDLKRIGTILTQKPGLKYLANETALNAAKVKPKESNTVAGTVLNTIGANLFNSVKIIGSTLAQVPLNGTGTHFVKGFAGTGKGTYLHGQVDVAPHVLAKNGAPILADATWASVVPQLPPGERDNKDKQDERNKGTKFLPGDGKGVTKLNNPTGKVKKETRTLLGDPGLGKRSISDSYATYNNIDTQDKINLLSPYKGTVKPVKESRDLIKFRFNVITPEDNTYLHFRAYLDSFSDGFSGNWSSFNYVGRGENFHTYQGFDRQISLGFKIAAQTRWEMRPLYQKIVTLASTTAPTYSGEGYMRGTFVKLTVGDYVREVPGFISSVNYTWQQDYQWEIAMNNPEAQEAGSSGADITQQELPMVLDCQVNFTPIHTFTPQTGLYHYITSDTVNTPQRELFFSKETDGSPGTIIPERSGVQYEKARSLDPKPITPLPVTGPSAPTDLNFLVK